MADALDSGSSGSNPVRVQVPFSALKLNPEAYKNEGFRDFSLLIIRKWGRNRASIDYAYLYAFTSF